jgi:putative phosphoribosyl transferase
MSNRPNQPVQIPAERARLEGTLSIPQNPQGIVLFAHGSGSSRHSPRNRATAQALYDASLAALLMDLLTPEEEEIDQQTRHLRFNINLLASRLINTTDWLLQQPETRALRIGYFGASTGAGAALVAAARRAEVVYAVVSRGGRPDLAGPAITQVCAPTLLIVGGHDPQVIALNQQALTQLRGEKKLVIVPGATHLFEEPGALEEVARQARDWFLRHLSTPDQRPVPAPQPDEPRASQTP